MNPKALPCRHPAGIPAPERSRKPMNRSRATPAWLAAGLIALAALACVPLGIEAGSLLAAEDDPAALSDRALDRAFDGNVAVREIEAALAADDTDLAKSYVELAQERGVPVPPE